MKPMQTYSNEHATSTVAVRPQETALDIKFKQYHRANPRVFGLFLRFTLKAKSRGYKHYSAKAVMERIRWHMEIDTQDGDGFKINNSYVSRYVRLLEKLFPEYEGFYFKRGLRS